MSTNFIDNEWLDYWSTASEKQLADDKIDPDTIRLSLKLAATELKRHRDCVVNIGPLVEDARDKQRLFKSECDEANGSPQRNLENAVQAGWFMWRAIDRLLNIL